ncbi:MAG TPA: hypothetical protein VM347_39120 [Nonomuraea sp.]|nr:hypothetical protein [Nonomuraea sp.]
MAWVSLLTARDLPLDAALSKYGALRRPRVERIIKATARTDARKAAGPVGRVIRDAPVE